MNYDIDIDIASAKAVNDRLPAIVEHAGDIKDNVSRLRSAIDPRVLNRRSLRERLRSTERSIEAIQNELLLLHRVTMQNIISYEDSESRAIARVNNAPTSAGK